MPAESSPSIVVVGGGFSGLATAFRLQQRLPQARITVLESAPQLGGVVQTLTRPDGCILELGPDSLLRAKPAGLRLIDDLGLTDQLQDTEPDARSSLIARRARLRPVPEGLYLLAPGRWWPFIRSGLVSWPGMARMLLDLVIRPRHANDETLASFVRRRLGQEALDRIAQPLVSGIYTADPEQLSLAATMPQFLQMEREHGSLLLAMRVRMHDAHTAAASGPRYGLFTSLRGGLAVWIRTLRQRLIAGGAELRCGAEVIGLERDHAHWQVRLADGAAISAAAVVLAGPAWSAAQILTTGAPELSALLARIPYAGVATINLIYRRDRIPPLPAAAGFVVPAVEGRSIIAASFSSRKYGQRTPDQYAVVRAFVGGALHGHHLERDDATLISQATTDVAELAGLRTPPEHAVVQRWPRSMAQYHLGHLTLVQNIRAAEQALPGVALVGNGYEGVGLADLAAQAESAAERLARQLTDENSAGG
jgi:protoporphyrinogen/coproporphyrinogen III oxidase